MGIMAPGSGGRARIPVRTRDQAAKPEVKRVNGPFKACDRCGYAHDGTPIGRAKHQVDVTAGTLYFCNHHFVKHSAHILIKNYPCINVLS